MRYFPNKVDDQWVSINKEILSDILKDPNNVISFLNENDKRWDFCPFRKDVINKYNEDVNNINGCTSCKRNSLRINITNEASQFFQQVLQKLHV